MKKLAPIVLFAFNRPDALKNTITSLLANNEAKDSELFIFVDGARDHKKGEHEQVRMVQDYVKSITGFKAVVYSFSLDNRGLGDSIVSGVTSIIDRYGRAIVLEDDLVFSSNFLAFMNDGLRRYEGDDKIFSICGYTNKVTAPRGYNADSYFCTRSSSWGWATWKDRWSSVDWELNNWGEYKSMASDFNKWGGSDCFQMLQSVKDGRGNSWAIRFCFAQFLQDKLALFPIVSKVRNDGFDGDGTNCKKWSRFRYVFDVEGKLSFNYPDNIKLNPKLYRSAMSYHTISIRLLSRLMYIIYK